MTEHDITVDKSIVDELEFSAKTAKRVTWEAWEFSVEAPHLVRVTNASWGFQKPDHSYLVGVEDRDGLLVPSECNCKADRFREDYDCKHKVAAASIGGKILLQAARDYQAPSAGSMGTKPSTLEDELVADGGIVTEGSGSDSKRLYDTERDSCACHGPSDDFPCWNCVKNGQRELPE